MGVLTSDWEVEGENKNWVGERFVWWKGGIA